jgi:hypothetical protein
MWCGRYYRTRRQQNAPSNNPIHPDPDEIEVTDPSHPLFGRRFPVRHISRQPNSSGYVYVSYRDFMTLRIPLPATQLAAPYPTPPTRTKLTVEAIQDLLSFLERSEPPCPFRPETSGTDSPKS